MKRMLNRNVDDAVLSKADQGDGRIWCGVWADYRLAGRTTDPPEDGTRWNNEAPGPLAEITGSVPEHSEWFHMEGNIVATRMGVRRPQLRGAVVIPHPCSWNVGIEEESSGAGYS